MTINKYSSALLFVLGMVAFSFYSFWICECSSKRFWVQTVVYVALLYDINIVTVAAYAVLNLVLLKQAEPRTFNKAKFVKKAVIAMGTVVLIQLQQIAVK